VETAITLSPGGGDSPPTGLALGVAPCWCLLTQIEKSASAWIETKCFAIFSAYFLEF
jgi:hypothetical protein